ncbi:hypothetical protein BaRGS_00018855 [Batillaria attramentaria]|uniref:Platelet-derived growth factor (PDGF) family profile domain-containing protein n=1 Tax=Batillaria attramentaria TaxID=370345 RepID=A0ABD0KRD1_9CAEN
MPTAYLTSARAMDSTASQRRVNGVSFAVQERSPKQRARRKQAVSVIHSRPPEVTDLSSGLSYQVRLENYVPSPAVFASSVVSSPACSRCSSWSSLGSAEESEQLPLKAPFTCALHRDDPRSNSASSAIRGPQRRRDSAEYSIPDDYPDFCAQCVTASAPSSSDPAETVCAGREPRGERGTQCRRHVFPTSRHRVQPEVDHSAHRKSFPGERISSDLSPHTVQPEPSVRGSSPSPCCNRLLKVFSRMLRMRYVGRCLLVLLLTGLGGLFAHVTVTDFNIDNNPGGGDVMTSFGGGVKVGQGYGGILPSNMLMKMNIRPVPIREFHEQLRTIRNKFDLLRIFLANKDISDASLKELLSARAVTSKDAVVTNDVKKRAEVTSEEYEYDDEEEVDEASLADYLDGEVAVMADDYHDKSGMDTFLEELEEAAYHIADMENSEQARCKHPQPQVVHIDDPKKLNRMFHPSCTVIHRCRNDSGCCGRDAVCAPKAEQTIFKTFLVVDLDPVTQTVRPDSGQMVERIALTNHTECECREKPRLPECTQKCPGVFRMFRYGVHCVCDCLSAPNEIFEQCGGVKDGIMPLGQDDLVCIKSGECGVPKCSVGEFNISTGYCPIKDPHAVPSRILRARLRHRYPLRHHRRKSVTEGSGDF